MWTRACHSPREMNQNVWPYFIWWSSSSFVCLILLSFCMILTFSPSSPYSAVYTIIMNSDKFIPFRGIRLLGIWGSSQPWNLFKTHTIVRSWWEQCCMEMGVVMLMASGGALAKITQNRAYTLHSGTYEPYESCPALAPGRGELAYAGGVQIRLRESQLMACPRTLTSKTCTSCLVTSPWKPDVSWPQK